MLDEDIRPLSEFRTNTASLIEQVRKHKRPLVLTQHGRSAVVVLDVSEYERLVERQEILADLEASEKAYAEGRYSDSKTARKKLLERLKK